MIVIDVETTGTDPQKHSLISIGAVNFERISEKFYEECQIWDGAHVDPVALQVNGMSMESIKNPEKISERELIIKFFDWLDLQNDLIIAGQNVWFDIDFIRNASSRAGINASLSHRVIDLHSICYFHMVKRKIVPPTKNKKTDLDSDKIMQYVGISAEPKPHNGLNGAIWEAEAFYRLFFDDSLFSEFHDQKIPWKSS